MFAGIIGLGWLVSQPVADRRHATVDQYALVTAFVVGHIWACCCSGVWTAITASLTAIELFWYDHQTRRISSQGSVF